MPNSSFHINCGEIFYQKLLFLENPNCGNQRNGFYYNVFLGKMFCQFDESPDKYTSKLCQVDA